MNKYEQTNKEPPVPFDSDHWVTGITDMIAHLLILHTVAWAIYTKFYSYRNVTRKAPNLPKTLKLISKYKGYNYDNQ